MAEPNEPIKALIIPNTGDQPGAWGTASVNPNFTAIGGMLGGYQTISLSAATTIALTGPSGSITPGAGPTQQQNSMLRFTGAIAGTATIQFSLPGFYIIDNQAGTSFPIILAPATGTGTQIGVPWYRKCHVFFDGTNMDYVSEPNPGTAIDLHGITNYPNWMLAGTNPYALIKDGTVRTIGSQYTALGAILGSTFGGNGVTTFGVPDERSRMRLPIDTGGTNRVTSGGSGINGASMGATGGNELMQSHNHGASAAVTDPGHVHPVELWNTNAISGHTGGGYSSQFGTANTDSATTGISVGVSVASTGSGGSQNMPPTIVSFLALIKT